MTKFTAKTQRAIKAYGAKTCRDAFRMHDTDGEGGSTVGFYLGLKTRQADAAIDAGREIAEAGKLTVRACFADSAPVTFTVSADEWHAELPPVFDCYSSTVREYQHRACVKKAAKLGLPMVAFQVVA
jgi:hypothetical protein